MTAAAASYPISPVADDEREVFARTIALGFGRTVDDEAIAHSAAREVRDRFAAHDGDTIVGTTVTLDFALSVPAAAAISCPGITGVTVQPTHRRRGVLTSLMRHQIDALRDQGESWVALYASEGAIYGRFGYGLASHTHTYRIDGPWKRFAQPVAPADVERLDVTQANERIPAIFRAVHETVPGMLAMTDRDWRWHLAWDPPSERGGASARQIVAIGDRAYASYRLRDQWNDYIPDGTLHVEACMATDVEAYRQIWAYLLGIDLVEHVSAHMRPVDDPLPWWLAERHRMRISQGMPLYVRLIDVGAALSQRGTTAAGGVTLDVRDAFCPWNARRWRLEGDGKALRCSPTGAPADATMNVRELASLSLGGVTASELARAGLIEEHTPGSIRRTDALLASPRPPWNPFVF